MQTFFEICAIKKDRKCEKRKFFCQLKEMMNQVMNLLEVELACKFACCGSWPDIPALREQLVILVSTRQMQRSNRRESDTRTSYEALQKVRDIRWCQDD